MTEQPDPRVVELLARALGAAMFPDTPANIRPRQHGNARRLLADENSGLLILAADTARSGWVSERRWGSDGTDGVGHGFFISLDPYTETNSLRVVIAPDPKAATDA